MENIEQEYEDALEAERRKVALAWQASIIRSIGVPPSMVKIEMLFHYDDGATLESDINRAA